MDTQESQRATDSGGVGEMEWDEGRRCVPARFYGPYIQATDSSRPDGPRLDFLSQMDGLAMKATAQVPRASLSR